jgi:hypothetical protein
MTTRKPRAMPGDEKKGTAITPAPPVELKGAALWATIRVEYITDPSQPSHEELARRYAKQVGYEAIRKKSAEERWPDLREQWWAQAETTLLQRIQDEYLMERVEEMRSIRQAMPLVFEHLMPIMEPDPDRPGARRAKRDPETGMPVFRHPFKSQEGAVRTWLMLQERQMLLRGEATMRTESAIRDRTPQVPENDPLAQMAAKANFSKEEVRSLARQMIAKRMRAENGEPEEEAEEEEEESEDGDDEI